MDISESTLKVPRADLQIVWLEEHKGNVSFLCSHCREKIQIAKKNMYNPQLECAKCHRTIDNPIGSVPVAIKVAVPDDWELVDDFDED